MIDQKLKLQQFAYDEVIKINDPKKRKEYKIAIEKFGMQVYANGLITTLAVLKANDHLLYKHLSTWLTQKCNWKLHNSEDVLPQLLKDGLDSFSLMLITEEALLLADELKAFVKAEF